MCHSEKKTSFDYKPHGNIVEQGKFDEIYLKRKKNRDIVSPKVY